MPIIKSAAKKMRVDVRRSAHNLSIKSRMKTAIKRAEASQKFAEVSEAYSAIDRAVKANIIHKHLAAHTKARLSRLAKPVKLVSEKVAKVAKKSARAKVSKKTPAKKTSPKSKSKATRAKR